MNGRAAMLYSIHLGEWCVGLHSHSVPEGTFQSKRWYMIYCIITIYQIGMVGIKTNMGAKYISQTECLKNVLLCSVVENLDCDKDRSCIILKVMIVIKYSVVEWRSSLSQ